jgi:alpha-tubulin suppressor-like RCC1 family protein
LFTYKQQNKTVFFMKKRLIIIFLLISQYLFAQKLIRGFEHNIIIKNNGALWAWGNNSNGQIGDGTFTDKNVPTQIGTETDWKMVVAGAFNSMAIKNDGTLWAWGQNSNGQLGDGTTSDKTVPKQIGTETDWKMVVAGTYHSMAIKNNGTLWAWGQNSNGQLGDGTTTDKTAPKQIGTATDWKMVVAGTYHSLAIKNDGTLWTWGLNSSSQLGDGTNTNKKVPTQIGTATNWKMVVAGESHNTAIKNDGTLWTWGSTLGLATDTNIEIPTQIGTTKDWEIVVAGTMHNLAIKNNGTLWAWGQNSDGQLGDGTIDNKSSLPKQVETSTNWKMIFAGGAHSMAIKNDGTVWTWGRNSSGQLGDGTFSNNIPSQIGTDIDWRMVLADYFNSMAIKNDGTLWAWGLNSSGQLGDGTTENQSKRTQIGVSTDWKIVFTYNKSSMAIKNNGTLWAWGDNSYGRLGDGTTINRVTPIQIGTSNDWKHIIPKTNYTLAIKNNGSLWKWGGLPDGTNTNHKIITQIGTDTDWYMIDACSNTNGGDTMIAIKNNGTLWGWGNNLAGQLGDGTTSDKTTPTQIGTSTDWKFVVADNGSRFLAIKNNGTLWTWGVNTFELGQNTSANTPTQVGTDNDWKSISAKGSILAIKNNGTLWGWGSNLFYQLGIGTNRPYRINLPKQIGTATDWKLVTAGGSHTLAIKNNGTLWAWGYNTYGQLGSEELYSPRKINFSIECVSPNAPNGNLLQSFNSGSTLSNIVVTGINIKWYASASGGAPLITTTSLINGGIYYASQTVNNCESQSRFMVTVTINPFTLPYNNFAIEAKSETCASKNNGQIIISAVQTYNYVATINGTNYNFVNNGLTVSNLAPGVYTVCISVTGKTFEQCYSVTIEKGGTITGKSTISSNKAIVQITEGTAPFEILVNGTPKFETSDPNFSVDVKQGDLLEVKTAIACEGIYTKSILDGLVGVKIYPNPTAGLFEITIPTSKTEVEVEIYSIGSQLISKRKYPVINQRIQLSLEKESDGVYIARVKLDVPVSLTIIKKS